MGPQRPGERDPMLDAPRMYRPVSALADYTEIIGHWHAHVGYRSRALPRGAITLIIEVGRRQQLDFYAADGRTRLGVPPAFLTGSHTVSYGTGMPGARVAADVGYFDQAHFIREFRSFTGMTPTQYAEQRILLPSHVPVAERVRHKYPRPPAAARS